MRLVKFALVTIAMILASSAPGSALTLSTHAPRGDGAHWTVDSDAVKKSSVSFVADVQRMGCAGGVTGRVRKPAVELRRSAIVVTFTVAPHIAGGDCPMNPQVPYTVKLGERVGNRRLLDGACLAARRAGTQNGACSVNGEPPTAIRWAPQRER